MPPPTNPILEDWNRLDQDAAAETILPCNGSTAWATLLASHRPFTTVNDLLQTSDAIWRSLPQPDWQQAFDSHPRIGERHAQAATAQSAAWSAGEQSRAQADATNAAALAQGNRDYEAKFGRIFLICATGKSAAEIFTNLQKRLFNDPITELHEAAEQQREITQLRLRKWLHIPTTPTEAN